MVSVTVPSCQLLAIAIQQSPPNKMGLATSTFYIFTDFGAGMGPFILGMIIPFLGYRNLYILMGVVVIAIIIYFFVHGRHHTKPFKTRENE